ncbi:MAG: prepilin-type N-terminal cleavage/methylation domain-containing protein [Gammaproteobacteria bacterium]
MLKLRDGRQKGFTLVEILIASVLSLATVMTITTIYASTTANLSQQLQMEYLSDTAHDLLYLMETEIRRSGYWHFDTTQDRLDNNPFQSPENDIQSATVAAETANSCILYAYDIDMDGKVGVGQCATPCADNTDSDNVEQFGFRLKRKNLQIRYAGTSFSCNSGRWQSLTDKQLSILSFRATIHEHCTNLDDRDAACNDSNNRQFRRLVSLQITAQLKNSSLPSITVNRTFAVRNDKLEGQTDD